MPFRLATVITFAVLFMFPSSEPTTVKRSYCDRGLMSTIPSICQSSTPCPSESMVSCPKTHRS